MARGKVLDLADAAGIPAPTAQTAISRLLDRSVFESIDGSQLQVSAQALAMFARGNRRIFTPRQMKDADPWSLVAYSLPETMRPVRHQLRKHFLQLGGGLVASGLWIFPAYLHDEVLQILQALEVRAYATVFTTQTPDFPGSPAEAARQWWDLQRLAAMHHGFIDRTGVLAAATSDEDAYRNYVTMIDAWRALPYLDPGLPPMMLPKDWPGNLSRQRFLDLSAALQQRSAQFARRVLGS